jgi:hypothetical protein
MGFPIFRSGILARWEENIKRVQAGRLRLIYWTS